MKTIVCSFCFFLLVLNPLLATDYYWVGGTGVWSDYSNHWATSSGGSVFHKTVPTSLDNVYFDKNSFNASGESVKVDSVAYCDSLKWLGVNNYPSLVLVDKINIYGSLYFSYDMYFYPNGNDIQMLSTKKGNKIDPGGQTFANILFNGVNGAWTLVSGLNASSINLQTGTLSTNNNSIQAQQLVFMNGFTALNAGTSPISCGTIQSACPIKGKSDIVVSGSLNITDSASFNSITLNKAPAYFSYVTVNRMFLNNALSAGRCVIMGNGNNTIHNCIIDGNWELLNDNTFDTIQCRRGSALLLDSAHTQTINTALICEGNCKSRVTITSSWPGYYGKITKSSGTVTLNNVNLQDVEAVGGATFNANNSADLGRNSGWNFGANSSNTYYWVGNSGKWSNGNHWATSSGGSGSGCVPGPLDNVYFDKNSFSKYGQDVEVDSFGYCNSMVWNGVSGSPKFWSNTQLNIYGSLQLETGMQVDFSKTTMNFRSSDTANTITTASLKIDNIYFYGKGGEWTLKDSLSSTWINLLLGTFNTGSNDIGTIYFTGNNLFKSLNAGTSNIRVTTTFNFNCIVTGSSDLYTGNFISESTASFNNVYVESYASFNSLTVNNLFLNHAGFGTFANIGTSGSNTIHNCVIDGSWYLTTDLQVDTLQLKKASVLQITASQTLTLAQALYSYGNCRERVTIYSDAPGSPAYINKSSGAVSLTYINIQDNEASGGASFNLSSSADLGGNKGWKFKKGTSKTYYWVGNSGNWSDGSHWATSSGGTGSGCVPGPDNNVYFDANSFSKTGQTVTVDTIAYCDSMDWTSAAKSPTFALSNKIDIYGSLRFISRMTFTNNNYYVYFMSSNSGNKITSVGKVFSSVYFHGSGSWTLQDSLVSTFLQCEYGTLHTNDMQIDVKYIYGLSTFKLLDAGKSLITCIVWNTVCDVSGNSILTVTNYFQTYATSSFDEVILSGASGYISYTKIKELYLKNGGKSIYASIQSGGSDSIYNCFVDGPWQLLNDMVFDTLQCKPGSILEINGGSKITVTEIFANGSPGTFCNIHSSVPGMKATIFKKSGIICLELTYLKDINATGGASFTAGNYCVDMGGNSGWAFSLAKSCLPRTINSGKITGPFCAGDMVKVPYSAAGGAFNPTNIFTAQLSDSAGDFTSYDSIGYAATSSSGTIVGQIPYNVSKSTHYRIRVVSNSPIVIGTDNGSDITIYGLPAGLSGFDSTLCSGTKVTLGQKSVGGVSYSWASIPTGFTSSNSSQVITAVKAITYVLSASTGLSGCAIQDTFKIKIRPAPIAPNIHGNAPICLGGTLKLFVDSAGIRNYTWSGPGGFSSTLANPVISGTTFNNAGKYNVSVDSAGCVSRSNNLIVVVDSLPTANTGGGKAICNGASLKIGGVASPSSSYSWTSNPAGFTSTSSSPKVSPDTTTTFYLTESKGSACSKTDSLTIIVHQSPKILIGKNTQVCKSQFAVIGDSFNTGYIYKWKSSPSGFTSADAKNIVYPDSTTTYYLTETIVATGCIASDSIRVEVNNVKAAGPILDQVICYGQGVHLGYASIPDNAYVWTNDGHLVSDSSSISIVPRVTSAYVLKQSVVSTGCVRTDTVHILVNPLPVAVPGTSATLCNGDSILLGTSAIAGHIYQWNSSPAGFVSTLSDPVVIPNITTKYFISEIISSTGCSRHDSVLIGVKQRPVATITGDTMPCGILSNLYNASKNDEWKYSWKLSGAGTTGNMSSDNLYVNWQDTGMKKVSVLISSYKGCDDSATMNVKVRPKPVADFNIATVCERSMSAIEDSSSAGVIYNWDFGDGTTSGVKEYSHYYNSAGLFHVNLVVMNSSGCTDTDSRIATVRPNPHSQITDGNKILILGEDAQTFKATNEYANKFQWSFGDGTVDSGDYREYTYKDTGKFIVNLITQNRFGCMDTVSEDEIVYPPMNIFCPNVFTPNGDHLNDEWNPVYCGVSQMQVTIYNRWGADIYHSGESMKGWQAESCQEGVYLYIVEAIDMKGRKVSRKGTITLLK